MACTLLREDQMQEEIHIAFTFGETLAANPHLADYFHRLHFSPSGSVEMADGAGLSILSIVRGKYALHPIDQHTIQVTFYDLREMHPYNNNNQVRELEPSSVKVTREEGTFAFRRVWWERRDEDESQWPCMLYWARYVFDLDPLDRLASNRQGSAYHRIMVEPDTRYYYCQDDLDAETLTLADLNDLGIPLQPDASVREAQKNKIVWGYR
ncbi:hypothetical protein KSX_93310 [Ktedonospora formicarum]|uniref:Uncharacterized protein n=2 Tax=Ktedonospora formicarum TaxID=2778364 RepID=A0A8J3IF10_9CHLR|nr:hypothetical protein KSX_93310 [Ktedonospora formicarum]